MTTVATPADLDALRAEVAALRAAQRRSERRARVSAALAFAAVGLTLLLNVRPAALAQTPGVSLAALVASVNALTARVMALETKTAPLTLTGTPGTFPATLTVTGVNVQIVNGLGATNGEPGNPLDLANPVVNGLGNLILGYNATGNPAGDKRMGSHDLILGDYNNYTGFGGLVAGRFCTASAAYASVTGGVANFATGPFDAVFGGSGNSVAGMGSAISGGNSVKVTADNAWAAGGSYGTTPGPGTFHSP